MLTETAVNVTMKRNGRDTIQHRVKLPKTLHDLGLPVEKYRPCLTLPGGVVARAEPPDAMVIDLPQGVSYRRVYSQLARALRERLGKAEFQRISFRIGCDCCDRETVEEF